MPTLSGRVAGIDRTFDLMAKGLLFLVRRMLPMMGSGGSIILVASDESSFLTRSDMLLDGGIGNV
jgi:NAD(P)-dependent dehydrogenase (short-subunit alcohol dehydrogenase family)